jgi:5-formyltetrahydrofolate cyclo-ligase
MDDKTALRREALARRDATPDRDERSRRIQDRLLSLEEYQRARTICLYAGVKSEVTTLPILVRALEEGKRVALPACDGDRLRLVYVTSLDDLAQAGRFGLLEPKPELAAAPERRCPVDAVDLFVVPGVAFDPTGGRIGYGRGFYDRLLVDARLDAARIGLAFDCQMVDRVPANPDDVPMHRVLTEARIYDRPAHEQ